MPANVSRMKATISLAVRASIYVRRPTGAIPRMRLRPRLGRFRSFALRPGEVPDDVVDVHDLVRLVLDWGPFSTGVADIVPDGAVDVADLVEMILNWGACD